MRRFMGQSLFCLAWLMALSVVPAAALNLDVPITHATLQAAVAAAAASPDLDNTITISVSPVVTNASVDFGFAFGPGRRLVVRPATRLARATVANGNPGVPIVSMVVAGNVTLQDLDLLRNITNNHNILEMSNCTDIVIERCRIGSNWPTPGLAGWANVTIAYPTNVTLRNNILFAHALGTFDFGIDAANFNDVANALRLYNNVVADYRVFGVRVQAGVPGSLVLLRNNVVLNHPSLAPEPVAFRTLVNVGGSTVVTSHNVVFASPGFEETGPGGNQDIAGFATFLLKFAPASSGAAFVTTAWTMAPAWDANGTFYDLLAAGTLHDDAGDYGQNVTNTLPDFAVVDDIDREIRPGGAGPHSDRGVDQVDPGSISDVAERAAVAPGLRASARSLADGGLAFDFASARAGRLELRLFDAAGRLLHRAERSVAAGSRGVLMGGDSRGPARGVVFFRLRLVPEDGAAEEVTGQVVRRR